MKRTEKLFFLVSFFRWKASNENSIWVSFKNSYLGTSLVVQWLRLHASTAGRVRVWSLVKELRSRMPRGVPPPPPPPKKRYLEPLVSIVIYDNIGYLTFCNYYFRKYSTCFIYICVCLCIYVVNRINIVTSNIQCKCWVRATGT